MESERNDFADLVRTVLTHFDPRSKQEIEAATAVLSYAYVLMHPETEWTYTDITDEVRAEVPHLTIPEDATFYYREARITASPLSEVESSLSLLGFGDHLGEMIEAGNRMRERMRESPDGRIAINGMASTPHGMGVYAGAYGWTPSPSERRVLEHALDVVSMRHSQMSDEIVMRSVDENGQTTWVKRLSGQMVDSAVAEAASALDDDKIVSVVDAWAAEYREEGR